MCHALYPRDALWRANRGHVRIVLFWRRSCRHQFCSTPMRHSCWRYQCQPEAARGFHAARPRAGSGAITLPELSLTGYEPTLAKALAQDVDSPLLSPLRHLAREASMTTVGRLPFRPSERHRASCWRRKVVRMDVCLASPRDRPAGRLRGLSDILF